jgi:uncharacterized protein YuzE
MVGAEAMNWTYDASARALYVEFSDHSSREQIELAPGVIVDIDDQGSLVGVEVLSWQHVDIGAIAKRFDLDEETAATLKKVVFQPVTLVLGYGPAEERSLVAEVESASADTQTPEFSRVA